MNRISKLLETTLKIKQILSSENTAELFTEKDLTYIGREVVDGYKNDKDSRKDWEDKVEDWLALALQLAEHKTFPWPGAANVKYPLITTAALQFSARAYAALLPGTNPVRGRVIGYDQDGSKTEKALRIGKHMSYQLLEQMDDWEEEFDKLLFSLPIIGCMFKKTYYSSGKGYNVSEIVYPQELVVNYWTKTIEEAQRITHILRMSKNDIQERVTGGLYLTQELEKVTEEVHKNSREVTQEVTGFNAPTKDDKTLPFTILEQHCWWDFDDDGYEEPYIVTVDLGSQKVLRIVPRFDEEQIKYAGSSVLRIEPFQYFTKFGFIPSPDGSFYDIGFGILLGPINSTVNTLVNQLLDAGTLSNMQSGFIARGIRIKGGDIQFSPGEWKTVNTVGDDLRKGLIPLPVREPSQVLYTLLQLMVTAGERLSTVTEVMTGEMPGQNTKATVAMAAIEQGMKVFSSIYKRIHRSLSTEYKKLFKLNALFLQDKEYFTILDPGQEMGATISKDDYNSKDADVVPSSDPNVATEEQKLAKLNVVGSLLQLGTINPQEYTKRLLEATEQPNIPKLMELPPPQPSPDMQKIQIEMQKLQLEVAQFQDESKRAWAELGLKMQETQAGAMQSIVDAQNAQQEAQQEMAMEQQSRQQDMAQSQQEHELKLTHAHQQHMLKMRHQDEMNQHKIEAAKKQAAVKTNGGASAQ